MALDIFLCFAQADHEFATRLHHDLEAQGYRVIGQSSAQLTSMRSHEMQRLLIYQADVVLVALSRHLVTDIDARGDYNEALNEPNKPLITLTYTADTHLPMEAVISEPIPFQANYDLGMRLLQQQLMPLAHENVHPLMTADSAARNKQWQKEEWKSEDFSRIREHWSPTTVIAVELIARALLMIVLLILIVDCTSFIPAKLFDLGSIDAFGDTAFVMLIIFIPLLILVLRVPYREVGDKAIARRRRLYTMLAGSYLGGMIGTVINFVLSILVTHLGGPTLFVYEWNWKSSTYSYMIPGATLGILIGAIVGMRMANRYIDNYFTTVVKDRDELTSLATDTASLVETMPTKMDTTAPTGIDCYLCCEYAELLFAQKLQIDLQARGFSVWVDENMLDDHADARLKAHNALLNSAVIVLIFSKTSLESGKILADYQVANALDRPIVPIILETIELPLGMSMLQWIDFRQDLDMPLEKLADTVSSYSSDFTLERDRRILRQFRSKFTYNTLYSAHPMIRAFGTVGEFGLRFLITSGFSILNFSLVASIAETIDPNQNDLIVFVPEFVVLVVFLVWSIGTLFLPYHNFTLKAVMRRRQFYDPLLYGLITTVCLAGLIFIVGGINATWPTLTFVDTALNSPVLYGAFIFLVDIGFVVGWIRARGMIKRIRTLYHV